MKNNYMKYFLIYILLTSGLLATTIYLAVNQIDGWGWFLFATIATFPVLEIGKKELKNNKDEK